MSERRSSRRHDLAACSGLGAQSRSTQKPCNPHNRKRVGGIGRDVQRWMLAARLTALLDEPSAGDMSHRLKHTIIYGISSTGLGSSTALAFAVVGAAATAAGDAAAAAAAPAPAAAAPAAAASPAPAAAPPAAAASPALTETAAHRWHAAIEVETVLGRLDPGCAPMDGVQGEVAQQRGAESDHTLDSGGERFLHHRRKWLGLMGWRVWVNRRRQAGLGGGGPIALPQHSQSQATAGRVHAAAAYIARLQFPRRRVSIHPRRQAERGAGLAGPERATNGGEQGGDRGKTEAQEEARGSPSFTSPPHCGDGRDGASWRLPVASAASLEDPLPPFAMRPGPSERPTAVAAAEYGSESRPMSRRLSVMELCNDDDAIDQGPAYFSLCLVVPPRLLLPPPRRSCVPHECECRRAPLLFFFSPTTAADFAHHCFRAHHRRALEQSQADTAAAYQQQSDEAPRRCFFCPPLLPISPTAAFVPTVGGLSGSRRQMRRLWRRISSSSRMKRPAPIFFCPPLPPISPLRDFRARRQSTPTGSEPAAAAGFAPTPRHFWISAYIK
ncbi:hypothetical protein B0H11DRAFT_2296409 [Mycena galericulata]|nr:hypothetical protein B0H11DRAFT_2296409 [Mycena galericulata]